MLSCLIHEVSLQLSLCWEAVRALQAETFDFSLTAWTSLPTSTWSLVTTKVDILRWEDVDNLVENIVYELVGLRVTCTEDVWEYAPSLSYFIRTTSTTELWISSQCAEHVARHINLRDNSDVTISCILHNFTHLILCIVTTVWSLIIEVCHTTDNCLRTL